MAEKEILKTLPCPVCKQPAYAQFDKGGKLFTMCDGRHPDSGGCGCRIYYGARNTAAMKSSTAKRKPANDTAQKPARKAAPHPEAESGSEPAEQPKRTGSDGWGIGGDW